MDNRLLPEWKLPRIALVWPEWFTYRSHLTGLYEYLLTGPFMEIPVVLIVKSAETTESLDRVMAYRDDISLLHIPEVSDIWVRDWGTIRSNNGSIRATYAPAYLKDYRHEAESDNAAGAKLAQHLTPRVDSLGLILDFGNFIHNGEGTAIMTERVLQDNSHLCEEEIITIFKDRCGIDHCVFVEEEPDDKTGHIDGTARFLDEMTIAVGSYGKKDAALRDAADRIADSIASALPECDIVRVPHGPVRYREGKEGMPSARGNHMNFMRCGNRLFVPCYGDREDAEAVEIISGAVPGVNVIPVQHHLLNELSRYGGVLNCISQGLSL